MKLLVAGWVNTITQVTNFYFKNSLLFSTNLDNYIFMHSSAFHKPNLKIIYSKV